MTYISDGSIISFLDNFSILVSDIHYLFVIMCQAEERKAALRKIPEQVILSEVRRMVEEMQSLNKKLEETVSSLPSFFLCMCLSICIL